MPNASACWFFYRRKGLSFLLGSVFFRGHSHDFAEEAWEIICIVDSELGAYLVYFHISLVKHEAGLLNLQKVEIRKRWLTGLLLEKHREVLRRVAGVISEHLESYQTFKVLFHEMYARFYNIRIVDCIIVWIPELTHVSQCAEEVMEHRRSISQVVQIVSVLQSVKYLFKQFDPVANSGMSFRIDCYRSMSFRQIFNG